MQLGAASRRHAAPKRQSQDKDQNGGETARGRGRLRMNESGLRSHRWRCRRVAAAAAEQVARVKEELPAQRAGQFGWAGRWCRGKRLPGAGRLAVRAGNSRGRCVAHAEAVREWIKSNMSEAGSELRSVDQKDRNLMLFNDWLEQNGYRPFADWVKEEAGWKPIVRVRCALIRSCSREPTVPTAESLIEYAFQIANGNREKCPIGGRPEYRNGEW